jgi:crotonobetainyl-CoA:carnitine CoA-transferase CaiB-like acyl-CoA transferase
LGEHGLEIMRSLGYSDAQIQSLTDAQVLKISKPV